MERFAEFMDMFCKPLSLLMEMPRRKLEDQIVLGPEDDAYFDQLPASIAAYSAALRTIYTPDFLDRPDGTYTATVKYQPGKDVQGKTHESGKAEVEVDITPIKNKIENAGYDVKFINLGKSTDGSEDKFAVARRIAVKHLQYRFENGANPGSYSPPETSKIGSKGPEVKEKQDPTLMGKRQLRDKITFDKYDLEYLNYFLKKGMKEEDLTRVLRLRYSPELISQAGHNADNPSSKFMDLNVSFGPNKKMFLDVPVNPYHLKQRLKNLADKYGGYADYRTKAMPRDTARGWLLRTNKDGEKLPWEQRWIAPNYAKLGGDIAPDEAMRQEFEDQQRKHLKDPKNASPNVFNPKHAGKRMRNKEWEKLVYDDVVIGVKKAIDKSSAIYGSDALRNALLQGYARKSPRRDIKGIDDEMSSGRFAGGTFWDLANDVFMHVYYNLAGTDQYKDEDYRIRAAMNTAMKKIRQEYVPQYVSGAGGIRKIPTGSYGNEEMPDMISQFADFDTMPNFDDEFDMSAADDWGDRRPQKSMGRKF